MTSGDKSGALTDPEARSDSDPEVRLDPDAHEDPAPAEPDPAEPDPADADEADETPDEDESPDGAARETGRSASAGAWAVSVAVLCALLIAGLVLAGTSWSRASGDSATSDGEQAAIGAARIAVTDLTSADYRNPGAYSARLKPLAVGQFLSMFGNSASGFSKILAQGKVQTTGKVMEVGVQKFGGTTAQLAVLADVTVKNSQTPNGSQRAYRLTVSMVQSGSKWLVSNVEFVQ